MAYFSEARLEGIDISHVTARLSDLSVDGAFIDSRTVLPAGTVVRLQFSADGHPVQVTVEIRYSMPSFGMGVRFLDLAPADRAAIEAVVAAR